MIPSVLDCYCWLVCLLIVLPRKVLFNGHSIVSGDFRALCINCTSQISLPELKYYLHVVRNFLFFFLLDLDARFFLDMDFLKTSFWCNYFT